MTPANDNSPRVAISPTTGEPVTMPKDRKAAWLRAEEERILIRKQKVRLGKRAAIGKGWDGKADNDNVAWPLAKALLAEGNGELLKYAMAYRRIHEQAFSGALLGGTTPVMREGFSLDRHIHVRTNGTIAYKHIRQSEAADVDIPARQYVPPYEDESTELQRNVVKVPKPWSGDKPVNDMIDAQATLERLRCALGRLCEPFELACIDGATLAEVGNSAGIANRAGSMGAGRALVHMALLTVRDSLGRLERKDLAA